MPFNEHGLFKHTVDTAHVIKIQTNKQWTLLSCKITYFSQFVKKVRYIKLLQKALCLFMNISLYFAK